MDRAKEFISRLSGKTKKLILAGAAGVVLFAVVIGLLLNNRDYKVMFTQVSSEEAKQIIGKLQDDGVPYQYRDGDILVPEQQLDVTKARLVSEDYPKSGFTYDVFRNNVGMMTTDADRQTYRLYELESRIGATIRLFKGVKEAYVTIALGEEQKYALEENQKQEASAQAVVVMKDGGSPAPEQAKSIQRLISRSIPGMVIENVSVFDGNGREVSVPSGDGDQAAGLEGESIAQLIEGQITAKVLHILGGYYGSGNLRVAVQCKVNMEKLMKESVTYQTPEKKDQDDKVGITSEENLFREFSGNGEAARGVAGSEANADIPQYNAQAGQEDNSYGSSSANRKYLVNQIKEQGQVPPGTLEDLSISVAINGNNYEPLNLGDIQSLVGSAAGIPPPDQADKITVVSAPFYTISVPGQDQPASVTGRALLLKYWPWLAAAGGFLLLLIILLVVILSARARKRRRQAMLMAPAPTAPRRAAEPPKPEINEEMLNLNNERTMNLRNNIREFTDQNPEISAQLLKSWLNGGDRDG